MPASLPVPAVRAPLVPPPTVMSSAAKPVTASEKVKVAVNTPLALDGTLTLTVRTGAVLSRT